MLDDFEPGDIEDAGFDESFDIDPLDIWALAAPAKAQTTAAAVIVFNDFIGYSFD